MLVLRREKNLIELSIPTEGIRLTSENAENDHFTKDAANWSDPMKVLVAFVPTKKSEVGEKPSEKLLSDLRVLGLGTRSLVQYQH